MHIENESVVESIADLVVGEVFAIHGNFHGQDIGLRVLGNHNFDLSGAQQIAWLQSAKLTVSEAHHEVVAVGVGALEVLACDDGFLVVGTLDWAKLGRDGLHDWRVVVKIAVSLLRGKDLLPLLVVPGDHEDGLGVGWSLGGVDGEEVVLDVGDLLD